MLSIPRRRTLTEFSGLVLTVLLNATLLTTFLTTFLQNAAAADEVRSPAEVTDQDIPLLGLSTQYRLGLPAVEPDTIYEFYPYWVGRRSASWGRRSYTLSYPGGPYRVNPYGVDPWGWYPWDGAPQTIKRKNHQDSLGLARPARLGLHYQYPDAYQLGLTIPLEVVEDGVVARESPVYSPVVSEGLALLKKKRYAEAGRILSTEIKDGVATLETYVVIVEVLAANGKYAAAARILLHGIQVSNDLRALDTMAVRDHFPSPESFAKALSEIDDGITKAVDPERARLMLLRTTFLLLAEDSRATDMLEGLHLSASKPVATSAKRLYMHFVDRLFEEDEKKPEAAPVPGKQGPQKQGDDEGSKGASDSARTDEV